jgi:fatty acid synthase subunit beta
LTLRAPASNENYARVSGDYNPIHVSRVFASYANLPGTITHGMYSSAAVRSLVETWAAENNVGRVRSYHVNLVGMVLPDDMLDVKLQHVGMVSGRKIIKIEVSNQETEDKVLLGEAEVEQPTTSYVFTGQGSQEQGMGMELYNSSPVAKEVWDRADKHFMDNYGKFFACLLSSETWFNMSQASLSPTLSRTTPRSSLFTSVVPVVRPSARTTSR